MTDIEYCKLIEEWSEYHENAWGCDCDMYEARKCQNSGSEVCNCSCHLILITNRIIIKNDCRSCQLALQQANMVVV